MISAAFDVRITDWQRDAGQLRSVRETVFIDEQAIPEALEWDDDDARSVHTLAEDHEGRAIGCARLLPDGHIGRVAVLREWRGRGVGDALMRSLLEVARGHGQRRVVLHSQTHACAFYRRHGFVASGAVYDEAGIPHQTMAREL
jgi:predicted GNAT family N-acyltransferase